MFNTILGPLDGSKLSEVSLDYIKEIATGFHTPNVILLTVAEPLYITGYGGTTSRAEIEKETAEWEARKKENLEKAQDYLKRAAEKLEESGVKVKTEIIELKTNQGVASVILDYAEKNKIDLIVMSTHGRSGISRWAMGSVTDRIVRYAKCPVLSIAPKGFR